MKKFTLLFLMAVCVIAMPSKALTVDDLTGFYTEHVYGTQWWDGYEGYDWQEYDYYNTIQITKIDENTVNFHNIFGWDSDLVGNINWEDGTITIDPQNMNEWYVFCQYTWYEDNGSYIYPNDVAVIATFNEDGSKIVLNNYTLNYTDDDPDEGWSYSYVYVESSVLSRNVPLYIVKGTSSFDAWEGESLYSGEATLTAYETFYLLEDYAGKGTQLTFTVDPESGEIAEITNGYLDNYGSGYWVYYLYGDEDDMYIQNADGLSGFEGNQDKGEIFFDYYYYNSWNDEDPSSYGTYFFTWNSDGIKSVANSAQENISQPVYNVYGIRVADSAAELNKLPKGIYIVNGKKYCVK